jgi:hypothetical protein
MRIFLHLFTHFIFILFINSTLINAHQYNHHNPLQTIKNAGQMFLAGSIALGGTYLIGTTATSAYLYVIQRRYADALLIWKQNQDDPDTACAELTRYVLKNHIRNRWFDNTYTNYPLVEYVHYLESAIFWLWALSIFKLKTESYSVMYNLRKNLVEIKNLIIGDYKYTKEKREFDERREYKMLHNRSIS